MFSHSFCDKSNSTTDLIAKNTLVQSEVHNKILTSGKSSSSFGVAENE